MIVALKTPISYLSTEVGVGQLRGTQPLASEDSFWNNKERTEGGKRRQTEWRPKPERSWVEGWQKN